MISENQYYNWSRPLIESGEKASLQAMTRIRSFAVRAVNNPTGLSAYERQVLQAMQKDLALLGRSLRTFSDKELAQAYIRGIESTNGQFTKLNRPFGRGSIPVTQIFAPNATQSISNAALKLLTEAGYANHASYVGAFQTALINDGAKMQFQILRGVQDNLRAIQIEASSSQFLTADKLTRRGFTQTILNRIADQGITAVIYEGGRRVTVEAYAEMLARTTLGNSARQAGINRSAELGNDLVRTSSHARSSPMCEPYQGRVFSLSGESSKYPPLDDAISGGFGHANCYSKDTEVYTSKGWLKFYELKGDELVLSLNQDTHIPEFCKYTDIISYTHDGIMYELKSNSFDLCVTPNHNLYTGYLGRDKIKRVIKYKLEKANETVKRKHFKQLRCVNWKGKKQKPPISGITMDQFAVLAGYYLSEGSTEKTKLQIAQEKQPNKQIMGEFLETLGFKYYTNRFVIYNKEWAEYFKQFGYSYEKHVPKEIKESTKDIIKLFLDAYILGDGSRRTQKYKGFITHEYSISTSSKRMADELGECILKIGKYPSYSLNKTKGVLVSHKNGDFIGNHDMHVIRINNSKNAYYDNALSSPDTGLSLKEVPYNDVVYCVSLEKNHVMWVRRNGKTTWSGNCKHSVNPYFDGISPPLSPDGTPEEVRLGDAKTYEAEQQQRYNERQIRKWKARETVAIEPREAEIAKAKVSEWQDKQRSHIDSNDYLKRQYAREAI